MTSTSRPTDPAARAGVYKRLEEVPNRYRLYHHSGAYKGRDTWEEFLTNCFFEKYESDYTERVTRRAGDDWKAHMEQRKRHHALATPKDVESWCESLLERMTPRSAYLNYWPKLEQFYTWLQTHTEHPHVYHPFYIAASEYKIPKKIWEEKIDSWEGRDD